jgi:hypothetical protein
VLKLNKVAMEKANDNGTEVNKSTDFEKITDQENVHSPSVNEDSEVNINSTTGSERRKPMTITTKQMEVISDTFIQEENCCRNS